MVIGEYAAEWTIVSPAHSIYEQRVRVSSMSWQRRMIVSSLRETPVTLIASSYDSHA